MILCSNPRAQYLAHQAEIDAAIARVLERGWYILGDEVKAFEAEFASYAGVSHAVGVGSGTEALHVALRACGIGQGDEVITVSHTAVATVSAIESAGATGISTNAGAPDPPFPARPGAPGSGAFGPGGITGETDTGYKTWF